MTESLKVVNLSDIPFDEKGEARFRRGYAHGAQAVINVLETYLPDQQLWLLRKWMAGEIQDWQMAGKGFAEPPPTPDLAGQSPMPMEVRATHFQNAQWAVTDWGLTSVKPGAPYEYEIVAIRLLETANNGTPRYDWPEQIAEKTWANLNLFLEAYAEAIEFHVGAYEGTVDKVLMADSVRYAHVVALRNGHLLTSR